MFEKRKEELLPLSKFLVRLFYYIFFAVCLIATALFIGMAGYHYFEKMSWIDAFVNAAMILSGMGPLGPLATHAGKLFAGFYALFSGLAFILIIGVVFTPVIHRFLHNFHVESNLNKKP